MATIKIPPVLRGSVGGEKEVEASGSDVGEVLRSLASQHPETESQLFS
jgi:molybdopterin synthase sulfur carrier subunit